MGAPKQINKDIKMKITANNKEYDSIEEAIQENEYSDIEIEDYEIGGGAGSKIAVARIGTTDDMADWLESQKMDMCGWIEDGQERTIAWHNGRYQDFYTCLKSSITQHGLTIDELREERITMFWDSIDPENDVWVYGLYSSKDSEVNDEEKAALISWYVDKNIDKSEGEYGEIIDRIREVAEKLGVEDWGDVEGSANNYEIIKIGFGEVEIGRVSGQEDESYDGAHEGIFFIC